ncbi:MAG: hypothetical protein JWP46_4212, partial [Modestobacter sp.]|nr:hypothetical protein [Modestobacter sp.]
MVQAAVNEAQAAFAGVTESQAALQRAQIDILKSLPSGLTTYAPGTGSPSRGSEAGTMALIDLAVLALLVWLAVAG